MQRYFSRIFHTLTGGKTQKKDSENTSPFGNGSLKMGTFYSTKPTVPAVSTKVVATASSSIKPNKI